MTLQRSFKTEFRYFIFNLNFLLMRSFFSFLFRFFFCMLPFAVLDDKALTSVKWKKVTGTREIIK